jgi:mercuric ion binding protein
MFFGYNPNKIKIMRFTPSLIVITLSGLLFTSCNKTATPQTKITIETTAKSNSIVANANPKKATFNIEGMTCAIGCAKTIQEKLASRVQQLILKRNLPQ